MKSLKDYIKESLRISSSDEYILEAVEGYRLNSVTATYNVQPEEIIIQAPENFQESDIQQYMDDMWLQQLPSNQDYSEKFFGKNNDNIIDAHFEYDSFEHIDVEPKDYIEWNPKFDVKKTAKDAKLDYFKITDLKYIIEFDRFDMVGVTDDDVDEKIKAIFQATESSKENEYPIEISFNEKALEYRK